MSSWNSFGSGNWATASNWFGVRPDGVGAVADFSNLANYAYTHHIDLGVQGPFKVGRLDMASSAIENYSLENGMLQMNAASGSAAINVGAQGNGLPLASVLASSMALQLNSNTVVTTTGYSTLLDNHAMVTGVGSLTKTGSGTMTLSDAASNWAGGLNIAAGTVGISAAALGSGNVTFTGHSTLRSSANVTLANDITVNTGVSATIRAADGKTLTLDGDFKAGGGANSVLHFGGAGDDGKIIFSTSSTTVTAKGTMAIDGGTLRNDIGLAALTEKLAGTVIAAGATLDVNGTAMAITHLTGSGKITNGGPSPIELTINENGNGTFAGVIENGKYALGLNKVGNGTLTLSGDSNFTSQTTIWSGLLRAGADNIFSESSRMVIKAGASFDLNGYDQAVHELVGAGTITGNTVQGVTLTTTTSLGSGNQFSGVISDGSQVFGSLSLVKNGAGSQNLSGINTYSGTTHIDAGTLFLDGVGSIESSSDVFIGTKGLLHIGLVGGSTAWLQRLENTGSVNMGGKILNITHQSNGMTGQYIGTINKEALIVNLENTVSKLSLAKAQFTSWTDGTDTIIVNGNSLANALTGSAHADTLQGGDGNDVLDGGAGSDLLNGGVGNDTYVLANGSDKVTDNTGVDTITSTITRSLASYATIEKLKLLGTDNINGTGNGLANGITGNAGNNVLDGGAGADSLSGGAGNDTYNLSNGTDKVSDTAGVDTILSTITRSLAGYATVEKLTLQGTTAIDGTGNSLANTLTGNGAANTLNGGVGSDTLIGGLGRDMLTGGADKDVFDFNSISETGKTAATRDHVTDFVHGADRFDFATIDANTHLTGNQAFKFLPAKDTAFTNHDGELHWSQLNLSGTANDRTIIEGDINGDGKADFQIELHGLISLTSADFIV